MPRRGQRRSAVNSMFGNSGTSAFGQNTATSTQAGGTFLGFGTPQPTTGTSIFGAPSSSGGTKSAFGGSLFGRGATLTDDDPPPVTTGTSTPAYTVFREKDPSDLSAILCYQSVSAAPAYKGTSLEELRVQDYQQERKTADGINQTSIFGSGTAGGFGNATGFGQPSASGSTSMFGKPSAMDPGKLERLEELLQKFLLGEELVNTQFHLFSARSSASGRVTKPRVTCANNDLLARESKYFLDLLSSDINPSDSSLVDLIGDNDIPNDARIDDYGYESDSDLDDCDEPSPIAKPEILKDKSWMSPSSSFRNAETEHKNGNESSDSDSDSDDPDSDAFVLNPEQPIANELFSEKGSEGKKRSANENGMRLRSLGSRHVLVKDTAFQTWYTLLNYLHTGKISFLPLSSTIRGKRGPSTSSPDALRCSAKSMYRLASKVGLGDLREKALTHIRDNLTEDNILKELSSRLVSKHRELLEMELNVLYSHIASPSVVKNFTDLAERIAHNELPHGAGIIVGFYTMFLNKHHPFSLKPAAPSSLPLSFGLPGAAKPITNVDREGVTSTKEPATGGNKETTEWED